MASGNPLEGTLPNVVKQNGRILLLSGVVGRSGGSLSDLPGGFLFCESGNLLLLEFRLGVLVEEFRDRKCTTRTATPKSRVSRNRFPTHVLPTFLEF